MWPDRVDNHRSSPALVSACFQAYDPLPAHNNPTCTSRTAPSGSDPADLLVNTFLVFAPPTGLTVSRPGRLASGTTRTWSLPVPMA